MFIHWITIPACDSCLRGEKFETKRGSEQWVSFHTIRRILYWPISENAVLKIGTNRYMGSAMRKAVDC